MLRWNALSEIPAGFGPSVVTMGNFDGVHRGHRAVLGRVVEEAARRALPSVAVTFEPHPITVLRPDVAPARISSPQQRADLIASTGVDALFVMEFTRELATWSPERFVREVFVDALHAATVVVGEDSRFGHKNAGDVSTLLRLGIDHGFDVVVLDDLGNGTRWSSSRVRAQLAAGDVAAAAAILGRPHRLTGTVVHGAHRGRELGFPTANLSQHSDGYIPEDGVYAGWLVRLDLPGDAVDRTLPAAISIGTNPQFQGQHRTVEAYVLDRTDLDLYDELVAVELVAHLRPMLTFASVDELLVQMRADVVRCRDILGTLVPGGGPL